MIASEDAWASLLGSAEVFGALSAAARARIARNGSRTALRKGESLFSMGDVGDAAYVVLNGEVEICIPAAPGKDVWLTRVGPGAVVGEMALLDGEPRTADVIATRRCELLRLPRKAFLEALTEEPAAAIDLLRILSRRLRAADVQFEQAKSLDFAARLAQFVLGQTGAQITESQSEIARVLGVSRESVNRRLSEWRRAGWVTLDDRGLHIRDPQALRRISQPT